MKKLIKKSTAFFLLLIAVCSCFAGCRKTPVEPETTPVPGGEAGGVGYTVTHLIRYWPEDADYETCDYACVAEIPQFFRTHTAGKAMNDAVDEYLEGLASRIEKSYMPSAVAEPPYTNVSCRVEYENGITSVVFTEEHCYEAQPYKETCVLLLDGRGGKLNLCDVCLNYHAQIRAAEAIEKRIAGDGKYFDKTVDEICNMIDVNHGAEATETGCRIYVHEGLLAPYEEGELAFDLTFAEVLPDIVGENGPLTVDELRGALRMLKYLSNSVIVRGQSVEAGVMPEYAATAFMGQAVTELGIDSAAGRIPVPEKSFLDLYRACFGTEFPGIDADAHSIRLEDGVYSVSAKQPEYEYNVDIASITRDGDTVDIDGDIVFGSFGYAFSEFVVHVTVRLVKNSESPFGWTVADFLLPH